MDRIKSRTFQSAILGMVVITFILAEIGTFLISGQTVVILSQIFYFPIIIIAFLYPRKAIPLSLGIGILYLVLSLLVPGIRTGDLLSPFMQFYVYVSLAVLLASFFTRFKISETKYEELFRHTNNAICIVDTATRTIVEMNSRFQEVIGTVDRKTGMLRLKDLFPDALSLSLTDLKRSATDTGDRKISVKKADGTDQTLLASVTPIEEAGLVALVLVDITPMIRVEQELAAQAVRLAIINRIIALSSTADNQETLLKETLHATLQLMHFESGGIYLIDEAARTARLVYAENAPFMQSETVMEIPVDRPPFSAVLKNEALFIDTMAEAYPDTPVPGGIVSAAAVPVVSSRRVIGSLNVAAHESHTFTGDERDILRAIGQQLGAALGKMQANDWIRREEENLQTLFNTIDDFVMIIATDGRIVGINEAVVRKLGYSRAELINLSVFEFRRPDFRDKVCAIMNELHHGRTGTFLLTLHTKAGVPVNVECQTREGTWNGEPVFFGISRDITERRRADEMLRHRRAILEAVNFAADRFLKEPLHGSTWADEIPAVIERLGEATDAGRVCIFQNHPCSDEAGEPCISMKFEWTHPIFQPRIDTPAFNNFPLRRQFPEVYLDLEKGSPVRITVDQLPFLQDAPAQKNGHLALISIPIMADTLWWGILTIEQRSEEYEWSNIEIDALKTAAEILGAAIYHRTMVEIYQNPVEHSLVGIFLLQNQIMEYVNPRFAEIFGYSREELTGKPFIPLLITPEDQELVEGHRSRKAAGLEEISNYTLHGIKKDGTQIVLELYSKRVEYQGQPAIIGTITDITARMKAEAALQESENMFRSLSQVAPVGIFLVDSRGNYFFVNDQWCQIMDLSINDAAGQGWLKAIHPDDRMAAEVQWQSFIGKGNEITVEFRLLHKEGSIAWVYFRALARRNAEGVITGYVGTIVDITDRKKYEETLKASLDEKSVLIMEIHHRVKNNLQIISGLIRLQSRQITNEQALAALHECETRVITMALVHESLYQSGNLANINAQRHITTLANTLLMSDDHERHIKMDIDVDDMPLDMNTAVPASLIINELVINSLKHAFSGRDHGTIRISLHREPDNMLALTVGDDGVGIPPGMDIMGGGSLGMKLVMRLVRDQLKGTLTILSENGMSFAMRFPAAIPAKDTGKGG